MLKKMTLAAAVAALSLPLAAQADEREPLQVLIGALPTSGYTGALYYAKENGLFEEAGLDVEIRVGQGSHNSINALVAGSADIVLAAGLAVIQQADKGQPIVAIGAQLGRSGTGLFLPEGTNLQSLEELEGKNIIFLNPGSQEVVSALIERSGADMSKVETTQVPQVGTAFGMYIGERADAIMTIILGKAIIGKARPSEFFPLEEYGMGEPIYVWAVNPDYLAEHEDAIRRFLRVNYDAVATLNADPERVVEPFLANAPGAKAEPVLEDYRTVLNYQCAPGYDIVGPMSGEALARTVDLYKSVGQIDENFDVTSMYTNMFFEIDSVSDTGCPG